LSGIGNIFSQLQRLGFVGGREWLAGFSKEICGSTLATPFEHVVKKVNTQGVENINSI
jgi:hypothetical protein